jgi:hypothetical protein
LWPDTPVPATVVMTPLLWSTSLMRSTLKPLLAPPPLTP